MEHHARLEHGVDVLAQLTGGDSVPHHTPQKRPPGLDHALLHELAAFSNRVPLALDAGVRDGRIKRGELLLLEAFGGGFTWGSALIRW